MIFLRFAEVRFAARRAVLEQTSASSRRGSLVDKPDAYQAEGVLYLPPMARYDTLLNLPEVVDIGDKVNAAMRDIEKHNPQLSGDCSNPKFAPHPRLATATSTVWAD
ncbi:MAG: type I restriction-modification system subunit M N-terminal domain-containing protein [Candidatus Competibacter sp.]